jgi:large subunit ribosomal protein L20
MFFQSLSPFAPIPREIVFAMAKGNYGRSNRCYALALRRVMHNLHHSFVDRRRRPGLFRRLWITRTNAATREHDQSYSRFISGLRRGSVELNRRILCTLAETEPLTFKSLVDESKRNMFVPPSKNRDISGL